jgi:general secretion pathway protein D
LEKETRIAELLKQGRENYAVGEFDEAKKKFEAIMALDPANTEAIRMLQKTAQQRYDAATTELDATRRNMMAELRDTWNPRDYARIAEPTEVATFGKPKGPSGSEEARLQIIKKMQSIQLPEIEFRQANIYNVVEELQQLSVEFDNSENREEKGVNIILNLQAGREGAAAAGGGAAADPFAAAGAAAGGEAGSDIPPITFSARYISLYDTLKIVTELAGLKFRVAGRVVMVVPLNSAEGDIVIRMYPVLPSVEEKVRTMQSEIGAGGGGDFAANRTLEAAAPASEGADWKQFFKEMGVDWPDRSSIKYVRSIGRLVVANTEENLTKFEGILSILNVIPNQIEIEARFVEISRGDATSLGFEWLLTDDWELAQAAGSGRTPLASRPRISVRSDTTGGFTKGNRYYSELSAADGGVPDQALTVAGILTNPELSFVLHVLEQKGHADLLSAPKVTTQAGTPATIKVVTEYIYPTDFAVTPITGTDANGNSTIVGGVVEPSGFETREVGVILEVTPDVSPETQMITLNMTPRVVSEPEWHDYGSEYQAPDGSIQRLNMQQPFFHTREVATSISIYNSATVVMGGMITERRNDADDKIPLLGDLPIVGRLFRSRYDQSDKRNLMIFVTARLVDPSGRPLEASGENLPSRLTGIGGPAPDGGVAPAPSAPANP